jgi:hypothetical protein
MRSIIGFLLLLSAANALIFNTPNRNSIMNKCLMMENLDTNTNTNINTNTNTNINTNSDEIINKYNELINRCCGEVNEKDEIEDLEKEFFDLYQKMKKHNKKNICRTIKEINKLFKK